MSTFIYEAYNKNNKIVHGEYDASSEEEVVVYLNKHNLTPLSIHTIKKNSGEKGLSSINLFEKVTQVDILFLVRNISITIKSGLSIIESLDILIKDTKKKIIKNILHKVKSNVENGFPLSVGFSEYSNYFPSIFFGMIKAGEVSGQLDKTLAELNRYLSKEYALKGKVKSALTYPIILLVASVVVVVLMLMFVLPKLAKSFLANNVELPMVTKFFLFLSKVLTWNYIVDFIVVIVLIVFFSYFRSTKIGKKFFFFVGSNIPVSNELIKRITLVRFSRTFGNLIGSGLLITDSLLLSAESIGNYKYKIAIDKIVEDIKNGLPLSEAISKFPKLFPNLFLSLVTVGERTGSLQEILITFSDFYEEEVDNQLKNLTSFLEPVLLLLMGLMIGAIAVSIILPIYKLVGNFV